MKDKAKKALSRLYATALILLAALLLLTSAGPIFTVDTSNREYMAGRFTNEAMLMERADFGIEWVITLIVEFDDFSTVFGIEQNELRLKNIPDDIANAKAELGDYVANYSDTSTPVENTRRYKDLKEEVDSLEKEKEDVQKTLEERLAKLTDADMERIRYKLKNDPDFVGLFACMKAVVFSMIDEDGINSDDPLDNIIYLMSMLMFILLVLFGLLFPVITAIIFLVKLIQYFINLFKADIDKTEKRMSGFPFAVYPVVMLLLFMYFTVTAFMADAFTMGSSVYLTALIWLVSLVIRAIKAIAIAGKQRGRVICKQILSLLAAVVVILMFFNFNGVFMLEDIRANDDIFASTYRTELMAQGVTSAEALDKSENARILFEVIFILLIPSFLLLMIGEAVALLNRFRYKTVKAKDGVLDLNISHLAMAIILTVIVVLPVVFNAPTAEAKEEAFKTGMFKTCYTEYQEEGTYANLMYQSLQYEQELGRDLVETMKQEIEKAPQEELAEMNIKLHQAERELAEIEQEIKDIETRESKSITCIVMGGLFILIEILYIVIPKLIKVKDKDDKQDAAPEAQPETPAEEAPAEEVPAEEAPAEEAPAGETPAEETPAEEAPAEETPAEPVQE